VSTVEPIITGILAALLTIFLTPRLQHYFWKRQRRSEFLISIINVMNRLIAEFITEHAANQSDPQWKPQPEFFKSWNATSAQLKALIFGCDVAGLQESGSNDRTESWPSRSQSNHRPVLSGVGRGIASPLQGA